MRAEGREAAHNRSVGAAAPLVGCRVAVTRPAGQADRLCRLVDQRGGEAVRLPLIEIRPPADWSSIDEAILTVEQADWVVFTSVNGVRLWMERMRLLRGGADAMSAPRIAVIGPATAAALREYGLTPAVVPSAYIAEGLLEELSRRVGKGVRILLPRAEEARELLSVGLRQRGADVLDVAMYSTSPAAAEVAAALRRELASGRLTALTLTSSSTARSLAQALGRRLDLLGGTGIITIGPVTSGTARELGLSVAAEAREHTSEGLIVALESWFTDRERGLGERLNHDR